MTSVDRVRTRASRKTGRWRLTGHKPVVLDGHTADWVLVVGPHPGGHRHVPRSRRPAPSWCPTWDVTRKVARLELDDVRGRAGRSRR